MRHPLLLVTVALTLAAASLASVAEPGEATKPATGRRSVDPSSCCEVDPAMCRGEQNRTALTRTDVLLAMGGFRDQARACLTATAVVRARVRWRVGPDGRPHEVGLVDAAADHVDDDAARCLTRVVSSWQFAATPEGLRGPITFAFDGPRAPPVKSGTPRAETTRSRARRGRGTAPSTASTASSAARGP